MKFSRLLFVAIALVSLFAGCSTPDLHTMGVAAVDIRPVDATLLESRVILTVRYTNEGVAPLCFSGSRHKLYLNGRYVGEGVSNKPFAVASLQSTKQEIEMHLENTALIRELVGLRDNPVVSYRLESALFQTIDEDRYTVKVEATGSIDLRGFQNVTQR